MKDGDVYTFGIVVDPLGHEKRVHFVCAKDADGRLIAE